MVCWYLWWIDEVLLMESLVVVMSEGLLLSCGCVAFAPGLPNGVAGYKNLNCVGDNDLLLLGGVI